MIWTILPYYAVFAVPFCTLILLWAFLNLWAFLKYRRETRREQQDD